jgi:hypothetical protein
MAGVRGMTRSVRHGRGVRDDQEREAWQGCEDMAGVRGMTRSVRHGRGVRH